MAKNKLQKFADMEALPNVFQFPHAVLSNTPFPYKGLWRERVFANDRPIVLELGCGRGEYTVAMAERMCDRNFVGIDIKGHRMWSGATEAHRRGLHNVRFLRAEIESIASFFAPGEVSEIWLTFPDPQMKRVRRRLTSVRFLQYYREIMEPEGVLHLKTDSRYLFRFTQEVARHNGAEILRESEDVYATEPEGSLLRRVQTYYEQQWLARGITIKYLQLSLKNLPPDATDPDVEIERDSYRSYGRQRRE